MNNAENARIQVVADNTKKRIGSQCPCCFPLFSTCVKQLCIRHVGTTARARVRISWILCGAGHVNRLLNTRSPSVWFSTNVTRGSTLMVPTKRNTLKLKIYKCMQGWNIGAQLLAQQATLEVLNYANKSWVIVSVRLRSLCPWFPSSSPPPRLVYLSFYYSCRKKKRYARSEFSGSFFGWENVSRKTQTQTYVYVHLRCGIK